ncbi:MAG: 30S ribosomal protein S5 [Candidatus Andersenbacteria bacterium CG10_big_fil_rev_8_21_14_0_10_54_11]|uniref:Small ribosomal subunit protein uS5 n=1 Tax=Candidatus Andersenbacteria bacterium CG10_big_fil_rev_8_21_14_0_10_54_11 TaxID=1974485 RepID=A0A2M6WYX2_9BACT|nr:MAG: 30S ribosomal protein S5 [Candidatus Andersenbacteria bacterium CG10_big_fil_rev_8_21_14_0_10_54_11]
MLVMVMATATAQSTSAATGVPVRRRFAPGEQTREYDFEVLDISRVVRVVKGGRRFSFRVSVVVGDRNGTVGFGIGKSRDIQAAITKAYERGSKRVMHVQLHRGTVPYEVVAKSGGARVLLRPARPGTGIISGGVVRIVAELAGLQNVVAKRLGSANKINTARAALAALSVFSAR